MGSCQAGDRLKTLPRAILLIFALTALSGCATVPAPSAVPTAAPGVSPETAAAELSTPPADLAAFPSPTPAPEIGGPTAGPTDAALELPLPDGSMRLAEPLAQVGYRVPLTLRNLTPTSASFSFAFGEPPEGYLLYRPDLPELTGWFGVSLDQQSAQQQLTLEGLLPGQAYVVQVGIGRQIDQLRPVGLEGRLWRPLRFETPRADEQSLRVGVIGDSGFGDPVTAALVDRMSEQQLDLVLHTGDVVYKVGEQPEPLAAWALKYFWPFAQLLQNTPTYLVPGNHEYDRPALLDGRPAYFAAFPESADPAVHQSPGTPWYAFSRAGVQFLMLDSQLFHGVAGRSEQTAWLGERLAMPEYRYSIAVAHTPPFASGLHPNDGLALRAEWTPLFEAGRMPLMLSGHDHNYERIEVNGVTYIVSGGGSQVLYSLSNPVPGSQRFARQSHFVLLVIDPDQISLAAIGVDGSVIDQAVIETPR